jgi:hypothetical protein
MHPLDGSKLKIERAGEHLERLDELVRSYLRNNPKLISVEFNPQNLFNIYRYKPLEELPIAISLLAGDAINNLRSSLEHLAWQLALTNVVNPSDKTGFPILRRPNVHVFNQMTADIPSEARKIIEGTQPYHRGKGAEDDPLWRLHALWTIEKHRHITIITRHAYLGFTHWLSDERPDNGFSEQSTLSKLDNGDILLKTPIPDRNKEYFEPRFQLDIVLGDVGPGKGDSLPDSLWAIYYLIRDRIIPRFAHFFK